jgi:hypothetical protein
MPMNGLAIDARSMVTPQTVSTHPTSPNTETQSISMSNLIFAHHSGISTSQRGITRSTKREVKTIADGGEIRSENDGASESYRASEIPCASERAHSPPATDPTQWYSKRLHTIESILDSYVQDGERMKEDLRRWYTSTIAGPPDS